MQVSKKYKNFLYFLLYLFPFILVFISAGLIMFNEYSSIPTFNNFNSYFNDFYTYLTSIVNNNIDFFPICKLGDFIYGNSFDNFITFYGCFYLDYCIWISLFIIAFDVLTLILTICRSFIKKLGGVFNE